MTFRRQNDDEERDDDFYEEYEDIDVDADLEEDDDEDAAGGNYRRPTVRPFGGSSSPGGDRSSSRLPGSRSGYTPGSNRPGASSPGGSSDRSSFGSQRSSPAAPGTSNRPSYGSSDRSSFGSSGGSSGPSQSRPTSSGRPGSSPPPGASRSPFSSSSAGGRYGGRDDADDDPSESSRPGGAFGNRSTGTTRAVGGSRDSDSGGSGGFGSSSSSGGSFGGSPRDRSSSPTRSTGSSPRSPGGDRGSSGGDKSSGGIGGKLSQGIGGLRSKLPGGGNKSSGSSTPRASAASSIGNRFGRGGQSSSARSSGGTRSSNAAGGIGGKINESVGNLRAKLPFGNKGGSSSPRSSTAGGAQRFGGGAGAARSTGTSQRTASRSSGAQSQSGGGLLSRIPLPFGRKDEAGSTRSRSSTRERMERASRAPRLDESGLTLDNKLDILGVVLVLAALALFFSSISTTKGQLTEGLNQAIVWHLGRGAIAVPIVMFGAGIWLILRHFGDEAPVLDPVRLGGSGLLYLALLLVFQFLESFNPDYANINLSDPEGLRLQLEVSVTYGQGGGWIGSQLYYLLITNITEAGMFIIMAGMILIGIMLVLRISAAEVAIFVISLWRSFVAARQRRAQTREVRARMAAAELAAAVDSRVNVTRPAAAELPGGTSPALPAGIEKTEEPRPIPITMGGKTVTAFVGDEGSVPVEAASASPKPLQAAGRLLGAVPGIGRRNQQPAASTQSPTEEKSSGGGRLGGLFSRSSSAASAEPLADKQETATPASPAPAATPLPGTTSATPATPAQPAAASAQASQPAAESPQRVGDLLRPAAQAPRQPSLFTQASAETAAFTASSNDEAEESSAAEDIAAISPATAKGTGPAPRDTSQNSWARPVARSSEETGSSESLSERRERLNAIRNGQNNHPSSPPEDTTAYPSDRRQPAASAAPSTPPRSSAQPAPVINMRSDESDESSNGANSISATPDRPAASPAYGKPTTPPVRTQPQRSARQWKVPNYQSLLNPGSESDFDREILLKRARIIEETLQSFGAPGRVVEVNTGPVITQFGVEPDYLTARSGKKSRVKVGAIAQLDKDLQLALGAKSIRIEAPVPGKGYVGIEVPNEEASLVSLRDVMESEDFQNLKTKSPLTLGLGQSVDGTPISADLTAAPHLLIAGTTGSGKSVLVNAIITSLIINNTPDRVRFIMVDPKRVELTGYNGIPHLVAPVVVDLERTLGVLRWVTREMDERYKQFSDAGARNIEDFNKHLPENKEAMPYIVVIIDELADLMMLAPDETERVITRIAALARATGIHLVIATQRPSVDVVTGLIKANFPARVAFAVAGGVDSRVILDQPGAERLLGKGDMLYVSGNSPAPVRLQGVFVSTEEIDNVVNYWKRQNAEDPEPHIIKSIALDDEATETAPAQEREPLVTGQSAFWEDDSSEDNGVGLHDRVKDERDELYDQAVEMVQRLNKASVSLLQRRLRIGYTRAARLIDMMEEEGIVGPAQEGSKPREVLKEHRST